MNPSQRISRRAALALSGRLLTLPVVGTVLLASEQALASKAAKMDFFYRPKPKDGKSCATCRLFTTTDADKGTCAVVEGEVSPNGWCMAYSPRT